MLKQTHTPIYAYICTPPCISDISPMLPLKQFQCRSFIEDGPFPVCVLCVCVCVCVCMCMCVLCGGGGGGGGGGGVSVCVGVWRGVLYTGMEVRKEYQFRQLVLGKKQKTKSCCLISAAIFTLKFAVNKKTIAQNAGLQTALLPVNVLDPVLD